MQCDRLTMILCVPSTLLFSAGCEFPYKVIRYLTPMQTPLHLAVIPEIAEVLIAGGAEIDAINSKGEVKAAVPFSVLLLLGRHHCMC